MSVEATLPSTLEQPSAAVQELLARLVQSAPADAVKILETHPPESVAQLLEMLNPVMAHEILACFASERRQKIIAAATPDTRRQWMRNEAYPDDSVGRVMEPPLAVYRPETTIAEATADLRLLTKRAFVTYAFVVDANEHLLGVVVMREMLVSEDPQQPLGDIMIPDPFHLTPGMTLTEAMKESLVRHFPVYPVCDASGRLVGLMRGQTLFEAQAVELSAQAGSMVGVEKEERLSTPWLQSLKFRHPWLQLNLLTAFVAAAVVGVFEDTIDRIVVLAVFLPVLAGQSGNTGCQALAVALRGMTLGELKG
ncbi:MAG: magnesium transporter, partial [Verrucomicrobiaceae bacterium]